MRLTQGDQLGRDPLELAQSLRDGVRYDPTISTNTIPMQSFFGAESVDMSTDGEIIKSMGVALQN